jgi:hypothetical protein
MVALENSFLTSSTTDSDIFNTILKTPFGGFKSQIVLPLLISNPRMKSTQAYQPPWLARLGHGLEADLELMHGLDLMYSLCIICERYRHRSGIAKL